MPRTGKPDHERVLEYFQTAHPIEANLIVKQAAKIVAARSTEGIPEAQAKTKAATGKPKGRPGPKPKAAITMPTPHAPAAPAKAKGKPGPKPGSKRRKPASAPAPVDIVDGSDPAPAEDFNLITDDELERELAGV